MDRTSLSELQLRRLQDTVHRVYHRVPFYRRLFDQRGITPDSIQTINDICKLPFTKKTDLRENYPFGLFAVDKTEIVRIHGSSGTKGKPTVVGYTKQDITNWAECVARSIVTAGGRKGDVFHNAYGYGLFTGGLGLHYGAELAGLCVIPVSGGNTTRQIMIIEDFAPCGIACTPSYLLNIAETMEAEGKDPRQTSLQYGILGAEPWSQEMRQVIEEKLNLKAIDIYGLSEVIGPGVAIECAEAQDGLHIAEDHFFVEVINPETLEPVPNGETGELVFTSLTKEAFPIIRYRTGDIANLYEETCRCGRTHVRMSRIKGRVDDMLIIRGVNVFPSEFEPVVFSQPGIAPNYQIVVEKAGTLDQITLLVELVESSDDTADIRKKLNQELTNRLKNSLCVSAKVVVCDPHSLPRSEGKATRIVDKRNVYGQSKDTKLHA